VKVSTPVVDSSVVDAPHETNHHGLPPPGAKQLRSPGVEGGAADREVFGDVAHGVPIGFHPPRGGDVFGVVDLAGR
jgi:hypothetical protein